MGRDDGEGSMTGLICRWPEHQSMLLDLLKLYALGEPWEVLGTGKVLNYIVKANLALEQRMP